MTQQDKRLIYLDLCARLPYRVKISYKGKVYTLWLPYLEDAKNIAYGGEYFRGYDMRNVIIKPYLRPMSSMTEEEKMEYRNIAPGIEWNYGIQFPTTNKIDWLNRHHFDYRGLIERGLALEALEGMYN